MNSFIGITLLNTGFSGWIDRLFWKDATRSVLKGIGTSFEDFFKASSMLDITTQDYSSIWDIVVRIAINVALPVGVGLAITFFLLHLFENVRGNESLESYIKDIARLIVVVMIVNRSLTMAGDLMLVGTTMTNRVSQASIINNKELLSKLKDKVQDVMGMGQLTEQDKAKMQRFMEHYERYSTFDDWAFGILAGSTVLMATNFIGLGIWGVAKAISSSVLDSLSTDYDQYKVTLDMEEIWEEAEKTGDIEMGPLYTDVIWYSIEHRLDNESDSGSYIMTLLGGCLVWVLSKIAWIGAYLAVMARTIDIVWRIALLPMGVSNFYGGINSPGFRYVKSLFAAILAGAVLVLIMCIGRQLYYELMLTTMSLNPMESADMNAPVYRLLLLCVLEMSIVAAAFSASEKTKEILGA